MKNKIIFYILWGHSLFWLTLYLVFPFGGILTIRNAILNGKYTILNELSNFDSLKIANQIISAIYFLLLFITALYPLFVKFKRKNFRIGIIIGLIPLFLNIVGVFSKWLLK